MNRYIDADIAHKMLLQGYVVHDVPTADVVEVTRCKYCKFYSPYNKPVEDFDGRCFARNCETDEYDFCSYGTKMDEEEQK